MDAFDQQGDPTPYKTSTSEDLGTPTIISALITGLCVETWVYLTLSAPKKLLVLGLPELCGAFFISHPVPDVTCAKRRCSLPPNKGPHVSRIPSQVRLFVNVILTYKTVYAYMHMYIPS